MLPKKRSTRYAKLRKVCKAQKNISVCFAFLPKALRLDLMRVLSWDSALNATIVGWLLLQIVIPGMTRNPMAL